MQAEKVDLEARSSILTGLYEYCRGIDRMDRELLRNVFHDEAVLVYPSFTGGRDDLIRQMWKTHSSYDMHSHQVTNHLIDLSEDHLAAGSESYVTASLWKADPGTGSGDRDGSLRLVQARYLDRWTNDRGQWQIRHRTCVVDIATTIRTGGATGEGRRDTADSSYSVISLRVADRGETSQ